MEGQYHFEPESYLDLITNELPGYERLQDEVAAATEGVDARRILDLGIGTGVTAGRVLRRHPEAQLVAIDVSTDMLERARGTFPGADLRVARLEDPLPTGPFDLIVSALAVHHLDGPGKADLFRRVAAELGPGGRFVLGDVIVPDDPADAVIPLGPDYDKPSRVDEQLGWLADAGLEARVLWAERDLAVLAASPPLLA